MFSKLCCVGGAALAGAVAICPPCLTGSEFSASRSVTPAAMVSLNTAEADTARAKLAIRGMTCGSCATTARIALERSEGVYRAEVSYDSATAVVDYDAERTSPPQFIAELKKLTGYDAAVVRESPGR